MSILSACNKSKGDKLLTNFSDDMLIVYKNTINEYNTTQLNKKRKHIYISEASNSRCDHGLYTDSPYTDHSDFWDIFRKYQEYHKPFEIGDWYYLSHLKIAVEITAVDAYYSKCKNDNINFTGEFRNSMYHSLKSLKSL